MRPTFRPSRIKRKRKCGFRAISRKILNNKRRKGRKVLSA